MILHWGNVDSFTANQKPGLDLQYHKQPDHVGLSPYSYYVKSDLSIAFIIFSADISGAQPGFVCCCPSGIKFNRFCALQSPAHHPVFNLQTSRPQKYIT